MKLDKGRAALVLVDAAFLGDKLAAEKLGVTSRTVENHRARLETDPELSGLFQAARREAAGCWVHELGRALSAGIRKLGVLAETTQDASPDGIAAITGLVKALAEVAITREVLAGGDTEPHSHGTAAGGSLAAGPRRPAN